MDNNVSGVKGWLLFFIIVFVLLFPFGTIGSLFTNGIFNYNSIFTYWFHLVIEIFIGLFSFVTGILLFIKHKLAVKIAKIFSVFMIVQSIYRHLFNYFAFSNDFRNLIESSLYSIVIFSIIYSYFQNSKRVRNTYS